MGSGCKQKGKSLNKEFLIYLSHPSPPRKGWKVILGWLLIFLKNFFFDLYVCGRYRQGATTELRLTKRLGLALVRGLVQF